MSQRSVSSKLEQSELHSKYPQSAEIYSEGRVSGASQASASNQPNASPWLEFSSEIEIWVTFDFDLQALGFR